MIVDLNGLQGFGTTKEVADLDSLADKFRSFGWFTADADGHDIPAMRAALDLCVDQHLPSVIVAKTTKGKGVSFIEHRMDSHYLPLDQSQYAQAVQEIERSTAASVDVSE